MLSQPLTLAKKAKNRQTDCLVTEIRVYFANPRRLTKPSLHVRVDSLAEQANHLSIRVCGVRSNNQIGGIPEFVTIRQRLWICLLYTSDAADE